MDAASGIAGLISLAALTAQTTIGVIQAMRNLKDLPMDLQIDMESLKQLKALLQSLDGIFEDSSRYTPVPNLELLDSYIHSASNEVKRLARKIETQVASLEDQTGLQRQAKKLRFLLKSSDTRKSFEQIQKIVQGLHLCHSEITRYMNTTTRSAYIKLRRLSVNQANDSIRMLDSSLTALALQNTLSSNILSSIVNQIMNDMNANFTQLDINTSDMKLAIVDLIAKVSQLQNTTSGVEEDYHWSTSVQASTSKELKDTIGSLMQPWIEGLTSSRSTKKHKRVMRETPNTTQDFDWKPSRQQIVLNPKPQTHMRASLGAGLNTATSWGNPTTDDSLKAHCMDTVTDYRNYQTQQDDPGPFTANIAASFKSDLSQPQNDIIYYNKTLVFGKSYRFSSLHISIAIYRIETQTYSKYTNKIQLQISAASTSWLLRKALDANFCWTDDNGVSSRIYMQLSLPRILPKDDALVAALHKTNESEFLQVFKSGRYSPNDLAENRFGLAEPLLEVCGNCFYVLACKRRFSAKKKIIIIF